MKRRVVVTGLGVVTSLSQDVEDLWRRLLAGESGIHHLECVETDLFKVKIGGDVHDWDPSAVMITEKPSIDRFTQFACRWHQGGRRFWTGLRKRRCAPMRSRA